LVENSTARGIAHTIISRTTKEACPEVEAVSKRNVETANNTERGNNMMSNMQILN
jgi:hypothetical protein